MADALDLRIANPPLMDFSKLADPFQSYMKGNEQRRTLEMQRELSGGLPKGPDGQIDFNKAIDVLAKYGKMDAAVELARIERDRAAGRQATGGLNTIFDGSQPPQSPAPQPQAMPQRQPQAAAPSVNLPPAGPPLGAPSQPVPSTPRVVGTQEGIDKGYYDAPPGLPQRGAQAPQPQAQSQAAPQDQSPQGFNPRAVQLLKAIANPDLPEAGRKAATAALQTMLPQDDQIMQLPDGTILAVNKRTGVAKSLYQGNKPEFKVVGKDSNGNDVHGFVDPTTQKVVPYNMSGATGVGGPPSSAVTGEEFLKTLDPGRANQIRAIADGRMSPPGGFALKSPQIQGLMRDVAQYEPGFDLTSWTARNKTRADISSGKMGQNITAFNTAIGHLETLDKAAEALNNSWSPAWNNIANLVTSQTGDPRVNTFAVAKTAVADELTRAFRGTGGNVHDLIQWEKAINSAGSPEQLKGAIKQAVELLRSRIEAVGDQYSRGMGKTTDPLELLSPKAKAGILRLSGAAGNTQNQSGGPSKADIENELRRRGLLK